MFKVQPFQQESISEKGNVLFLILIAVALFAALSYAVTQSSRSGSGDANNETNLISGAQITQYPSSIRTSIIRMMVSNSIEPNSLEFNSPSDFDDCTGAVDRFCVFHPDGGGATFAPASAEVVTTGSPQPWVFNGENEINLVGTTVGSDNPDADSAEVIAFLPNVQRSVCTRINEELGINGIPSESTIDVATQMGAGGGAYDAGIMSGNSGGTIDGGGALNGQAFGCFVMGGVNYYYHALVEQ